VVAGLVVGAAFVGAIVVATAVVVDAEVGVLVLALVLLHAASTNARLATIPAGRSIALRGVVSTTDTNATPGRDRRLRPAPTKAGVRRERNGRIIV